MSIGTNFCEYIVVIFDLSWQFGFGTFAAYLIGIATAVFDVSGLIFSLAVSGLDNLTFAY